MTWRRMGRRETHNALFHPVEGHHRCSRDPFTYFFSTHWIITVGQIPVVGGEVLEG